MKKSIKYAGIAAATLLAVAPVAAPVVSNTTTVKAETTTPEITNDNITTAVNELKGVMSDTTYGDNSTNGNYPDKLTQDVNYDKKLSVADFLALKMTSGISASNANVLADTNVNATVKVYAVDASGNKYSYNNYSALYDSVTSDNGSIKYGYELTYSDKDGDNTTTTKGTFTLTNNNNYSEVKALNLTFTNPLEVAYGSKTVNTKLSTTIDATVKDQNGNTLELDSDNQSAGVLYKSLAGAKATDSSDVYSDATFGDSDKTYYQPVTIVLKDGKLGNSTTTTDGTTTSTPVTATSIVNNYIAGKDNYSVNVNGSVLSATDAKNMLSSTAANSLTFIREVHVSQNASWTTEDVKGIVTTKSDASYYTLKDGNNKTITNRALAKNTAWQTNAVRTDANGNKQYRVGGDEWIDANNVTFSDKTTDNNGEGAYTNVKALNGVAKTAGPSGFVYPLFDDNGKQVTNRAVAGDTAWYTDKSAVNADGVTVYHVATGEWLQGNNVTYTAY